MQFIPLLKSLGLNLVLISFLYAGILFVDNPSVFSWVFVGACVWISIYNRKEENIWTLLVIIASFRIIEETLITFAFPNKSLLLVNSMYLVLDTVIILAIFFRPPICRMLTGEKQKKGSRFQYSNADFAFLYVYKTYLLVSLLAILEFYVRRISWFSPEASEWAFENVRLIFNNYILIKHSLNVFEVILVLVCTKNMLKQKRDLI